MLSRSPLSKRIPPFAGPGQLRSLVLVDRTSAIRTRPRLSEPIDEEAPEVLGSTCRRRSVLGCVSCASVPDETASWAGRLVGGQGIPAGGRFRPRAAGEPVPHRRVRGAVASGTSGAFITETLERFPTLTAARLFDMVKARGYTGGPDHFRHRIAQLRPRRPREAYLRLRTLAGEQAQVDWMHFGKLTIGRAERPLMAFVLVLSYSRYPFVRFYLGASLANLSPFAKSG